MKLVSESTVEYLNHMGDDLSVVDAARVSFEKCSEWEDIFQLSNRDQKLITYLAKHKHKSPFNHCFASFRVTMPVFVARQLVKHEYLTWNEVSRRYVDSEPEFYLPEVWRKKADNVKQGSSEEEVDAKHTVSAYYEEAICEAYFGYNELLERGVCPEQARMVLPQSMMTQVIWSGSLAAFAKMCNLRLDPHSQRESSQVAEQIDANMANLYPHSWAALREYPIL